MNIEYSAHQIQIFARFREEEALHSIFQTHVNDIVYSCIPALGFCVCIDILDNLATNVQVKRVLGRLETK